MFDVVAANDDQLALPVDLESVNDSKPLLAAASARQLDAAAKDYPEEYEDKRHADEQAHRRQDKGERAVLSEKTHELHVLGSFASAGKRIKLT
ncbi:MAG TPA: hypothetical protein VFE89_11075 [Beijerinckiaceae bacterium]|jgi:hypothetical protein|nr:hypothetical protein [Beijerinckiaceae bacterium]